MEASRESGIICDDLVSHTRTLARSPSLLLLQERTRVKYSKRKKKFIEVDHLELLAARSAEVATAGSGAAVAAELCAAAASSRGARAALVGLLSRRSRNGGSIREGLEGARGM